MSQLQRDPLFRMQVNNALSVLGGWYLSWEFYSSSAYPALRAHALYSKARGLVEHDRALIKSMDRLEGRAHG
ncbi:hypothetical protein [Pseudomonas putida]|uniref:hypothetical protein n=1 Tax=Pseudomonas putida TaxID=303 RepID=UPI00235BAEC9|nr:hypothetical protein [Pseudomonas putida]GLO44184.1 hypothetical protein PPUN109347_07460 [Pseudomonas putida]HDS0979520.1 hypothetical protein [Pseudomonas putida]